jgi:hypothetical protein
VDEVVPACERQRVRARDDRERVDAVRGDDPDRDQEEEREPADRQAEEARSGEIDARAARRQEAFTSSQSLA